MPLKLRKVAIGFKTVVALKRAVVPDPVEELLLSGDDLVKSPRLLLEVGVGEQFLYLLAEMASQVRI